jgi:tetratricopeptide (TPR) repeat protein
MTRRRILLGVVAVLAVGLGLAGYWWYRSGQPRPPEVDTTGYDPDIAAAIAEAREAVRQEPDSGAAWGKLAMRLLAHGFQTESQACLARAEYLDPDNPRWVYLEGRLVQLRDPEAALPLLRRAATLARNTSMPRLHLAETLLSLGLFDEAEAEFRRVLKHEPNNPRVNAGLGRLTYQRGDLDTSLKHVSLAARIAPQLRSTHALLAEIHHRRGDHRAEELELELMAQSQDRTWPDPYMAEVDEQRAGNSGRADLAFKLVEQGLQEQALMVLVGGVRDFPNSYNLRLMLGRQLARMGDFAGAEQQLRAAVQIRPDSIEALGELGLVLQQRRDHREAARCYEQVLALQPGHSLAHFNLANCRNQLGDRAGALESLRAALRANPEFAWAYRVLGRLLTEMNQNAEAVGYLEQALRLDPRDTESQELLARARAGRPLAKP